MEHPMEPLSHYHVFYITARCGNISRASQELYISQPAVSKSIRRLEEDLGVTLFKRNSRGVTLTEEGELLYQHVQEAFQALDTGEQLLNRRRKLGVSHLRIGASTIMCKYVLLPYLQNFVCLYPHIRITISCQSTYQTLNLLQDQKVDIGFVGRPDKLKGLDFFPLRQIQDTFVATQTYLDNLSLRETDRNLYHTATFMMLDEENLSRQFVNTYFQTHGIELKNILEVSSIDLLIEFAKIGLGAACVVREFVLPELEKGELIELPLDLHFPSRQIGFALAGETRNLFPVREFLQLFSSLSC